MSRRSTFPKSIAATCRFFGYLNVALAWLWVGVLVLPSILESGVLDILESAGQGQAVQVPTIEASPFTTVIAVVVTTAVLILTILTLLRLPRSVTRAADKSIGAAGHAATPIITHGASVPTKQKKVVRRRIVLMIQLALLLIPLAAATIVPTGSELSREIVLIVSLSQCISGATWFTIAFVLELVATSRTRSHASRVSH